MTGQPLTARPFARRLAALRSGSAMSAALLFSGLAIAGLPAAAQAQGFNGTVASSTNVSINAGNTDVTVLAQEAIIDWNATGANATATNVDFLPAGGSVLFHDIAGSSSGSFTVLNRINPTYTDPLSGATTGLAATISLSGTVNSTISVPDGAGGFNNVQGGNVWFYSPYGIIANGTSAFNVGSLLLTTSDIDTSNGGSLYLSSPSGGQRIGFLPAAQAGSFVRVLPGAQINAAGDPTLPNSAYVGVFAPRIEQGGAIASDGMTALVAGEAGTITFNLGLIDVAVTTGTTDANGVVHTGTTGGPASSGEAQSIALVAMPQNTALTMLLSGSIGYTPAAVATPDGSAVVLNAGFDPALPSATLAAGYGNIGIANTTFANLLNAVATGGIDVSATVAGLTRFGGTASLSAGRSIALTANADQEIRADDALLLGSLLPYQAADVALTITAGTAPAAHGRIAVANVLDINANADPVFGPVSVSSGVSATGGTVTLAVSGGTLSATNGLSISANGAGESGFDFGGSGTGGTISITAENQGTISAGSFFVAAHGFGGSADGSTVAPTIGVGGDGFGGTIILSDGSMGNGFGTLSLPSPAFTAQGFGGSGASVSGSGFGGAIAITIGAAQSWGVLIAEASATNGGFQQFTTDLGNATGQQVSTVGLPGGITLDIAGSGALTLTSAVLINNAYMQAGSAAAHAGRAGGVAVRVVNGGTLTVSGDLTLNADATVPSDSGLGDVQVAPLMVGGNASLLADTGGTVTLGELHVTANALGFGAGFTGNAAMGGVAQVGARFGSTIELTGAAVNTVVADAYGAVGPAAGSAVGGIATVFAQDGTIRDTGAATLLVSGSAVSGGINYQFSPTGTGFDASGGEASVELIGGATSRIEINTIDLRAQGNATLELQPDVRFGPASFTGADIVPIIGNGGTGTGGLAEFRVHGGTLLAGALSAYANGIGGSSGFNSPGQTAFVSGNGFGGQAGIDQTAGAINAGVIDANAVGHGGGYDDFDGNGGVQPLAGTGFGGIARATLAGGTLTLGTALVLNGGAIGGAGSSTTDTSIAGGNGGAADASTGIAELLMPAGSTALLTSPSVTVTAGALGGAGGVSGNVSVIGTSGNGGAATGGTARLALADGGISVSGSTTVAADATGGDGNTGGNAVAGTAGFALADTLAAPSTTRGLGPLLLSATPTGGTGTAAGGATTAGRTLFTAQAGRLASALTITGDFTAIAPGATAPAGDGFTGSFGAIPVTITGNALIATSRDVTMAVAAGGGANIGGTLTISGRTISSTGTGVLSATGDVAVTATTAIAMGGLSSGGATLLVAQDSLTGAYGLVTAANLNSTGPVTAQSSAFTAGSSGALNFADSFATAGDFIVSATGNLTVANVSAGGDVSLTSTGGTVRNTGTVSSSNAIALDAGGAVLIDGALIVPGLLKVLAGGAVTASVPVSAGSIDIAGNAGITIASLTSLGSTDLQSTNGAILINNLSSASAVTLSGQSVQVDSSGALTIASAASTAGDLSIQAADGLTVTDASAAGNLLLGSLAGPVTATGGVSATGNATISGSSVVTLASLSSGGTTDLSSTGAIDVTSLSSVGPVAALGAGIDIGSPGSLSFSTADAGAGDLIVAAAGSLGFTSASAGGLIDVSSGGVFTLAGGAVANTIFVASRDIQLGPQAQLGLRELTTNITLRNNGAGAGTFLGGAGQTGTWSLDAAEAARLFADQSIVIVTTPITTGSTVADVVIGNLALSYGPAFTSAPSANLGNGGIFVVSTAGRIAVTGPVRLTSSAANDLFALSAGTIDVVGPNGSIAMLDANGGLSGTLGLSANFVRAGSAAALADIAGAGSVSQISTRLGFNDGIVSQTGYLQADAISVYADSGFFVQNTGVSILPVDRRGFTANSLSINSEVSAPAIAINGVLFSPNSGTAGGTVGTPITGTDTQFSIFVNGVPAAPGGAFDPLSTVNGCVIGGSCDIIPPVVIIPSKPIIDFLPLPPTGGGPDALLNLPIIQFGTPPLLDSPPLIDEPVTGVGNDDLWQRRCGDDTDCHG